MRAFAEDHRFTRVEFDAVGPEELLERWLRRQSVSSVGRIGGKMAAIGRRTQRHGPNA